MNKVLIIMMVMLFASCGVGEHRGRDIELINDVMKGQARSWNNGDLEGYMHGYWMSDSLIFTGTKSVSHGWQAALDRYKAGYPNKAAMGRLEFDKTETNFVGKEAAYSVGQWTLYRESDTLSGRFTLVWRKLNGAWFIVADHSS